MKATERLHELGQSLWLDNITRPMLAEGVLQGYIDELSVTGLTSNPTIFDKAIGAGDAYDQQISEVSAAAESGEGVGATSDEKVFFELAIADLRDATTMFAPVHERTDGVDGWASLEVSPLLADDAEATIEQAAALHAKAERENLFIKIPGTEAGQQAIEETIFAGVPVNVTLLFDDKHYLGAADAYMKGIERRIEAGLDPNVGSVASLFISRWDAAVADSVPAELKNRLGVAIGGRAFRAYHELLESDRWQRLLNEGARAQRLLWASTGTKDPEASDTLYIEALASPFTVNTMPEPTLVAFSQHGEVGDLLPKDGGNAEAVLREFADAGIDVGALAARLQEEGKASFVKSWEELLGSIASKRGVVAG
ncbi:MAG TPA: transaldolase [Solirubrobacterales bacterium]|jgi:transaldolase|nr:transaldolase [Solirubrobacterales bacterium]